VDVTTQVPPEPVVMPRPLNSPDPVPLENIPPPKNIEDNSNHNVEVTEAAPAEKPDNDFAPKPEPVSSLNEEGIPNAWSIQVSSFESEKNANDFEQQLKDAGYTAYTHSSKVGNKQVHRVFVGPKINRDTALATKAEIDKKFKTQAMLVEFKP